MAKMTTSDQALAEYTNNAVLHGQATEGGRHRDANKAHDRLLAALAALTAMEARGRLTELFEHEDASVRCWAATHLLGTDEANAKRVLDELASRPDFVGLGATQVLKLWGEGRLTLP